jgi:FkbM family methyltransferase
MRLVTNYIRWQLLYKDRGKRWLVTFDNGMRSWVYPNPQHGQGPGEEHIWTKNVDYHDEMLIRRVLTQGDFIVDAGCNVGNRTWALADLISGALMIDAGDSAIERVRENLRLNGLDEQNYPVVCQAVGAEPGEVFFTDIGGAHTQNRVITGPVPDAETRRVAMTTIDAELERLGRTATFIKVDVEGQDLAALQGAARALRSGSVKLVKFEHLPSEPLRPLLDFFDPMDWTVFALDQQGRVTTDPGVIERNMNLFAAPSELLSGLRG